MGGMALNDGKLAEMATGEGKTLVAVLPVYLNALSGKYLSIDKYYTYHHNVDSKLSILKLFCKSYIFLVELVSDFYGVRCFADYSM